ncbi:Hsp70 family protein [Candidatus Mycobacterium wuenschmannii]|uniref:Hsp70 family protein n=1 Tax=Candidatus Mycobacterium wuenschmannii TaxID=3027808 RepID=A0ABY8W247_9MYCO|nr:Hsp70 family protein [Candidatus Mycobacterium wuenschmannii]WIM89290.1 Hsp70 family protein [Candidatus Mycobacterium wuenschmannii]
MADGERVALGLSVGATNLAAVTADRSVTRKPVLTLFRQRPPEVGVPSENPKLNEPGLVITDFVDRVGDPAGIAAADNTTHRSETLIADALRALAYTATDGRTLPDAVAVTHPAHWDPAAVNSVRVALSRVSEWSRGRLVLLPDSAAALYALHASPGIPDSGIIAVCDFGGSGTTVSLVDAADGYQAVAPAVRHTEFAGDRIDQALLTHVINDLSTGGSFDTSATSAIGSLKQLRTACRFAKERLSSANATALTADVPGYSGQIEITRGDLEDAIRQPLDSFVGFFHDVLQRNGIRLEDLAAVASVGGGAAIPFVTRTLSEQSGALVISAPRPHLTAAVGAALRAAHGPGDGSTALAPTALGSVSDATTISEVPVEPAGAPALAWSEADDDSGIMPIRPGEYDDVARDSAPPSPRPRPRAALAEEPEVFGPVRDAWYRRPLVVAVGTALAVLAVGAGVMITLRHTSGNAPSTPSSSVSTTAVPSSGESTASEEPSTNPPSSAAPETTPPSSSQTPTTTTTTESPTSTTTTTTTTTTTSERPRWPDRPRWPRGPGGDGRFPEPGQGGR